MSPETESERLRVWLRQVIHQTGLRPTPFAKGANVAPSTILRALDAENPVILDARTIGKIVQKYSVRPPDLFPRQPGVERPARPGFSEPEAAPYQGAATAPGETPTIERWEYKSRSLEQIGFMPGDILFVDRTLTPRAGDVVCAQLYDLQRDSAETIFREYDPPYLLTRATDPAWNRKPAVVDNERVVIMGVVIQSTRIRRD